MFFTVPVAITDASGGPSWTDIVTAVGTGVLAFFAIVTAVFALLAWQGQKSQLADLFGERKREAEERRREQAVQVYVWQIPPSTHFEITSSSSGGMKAARMPDKEVTATLVNSSPLPIFAVKMGFMRAASQVPWGGLTVREPPLMPEKENIAVTYIPADQDIDDLVAVAYFRDRAGVSWVTFADGRLDEQDPPAGPTPRWARRQARRLKTWTGRVFSYAAARGRAALATAAGLLRRAWRIVRATPRRSARIWPSARARVRRLRLRG